MDQRGGGPGIAGAGFGELADLDDDVAGDAGEGGDRMDGCVAATEELDRFGGGGNVFGPVDGGCGVCVASEVENPRWQWPGCAKPLCTAPSIPALSPSGIIVNEAVVPKL